MPSLQHQQPLQPQQQQQQQQANAFANHAAWYSQPPYAAQQQPDMTRRDQPVDYRAYPTQAPQPAQPQHPHQQQHSQHTQHHAAPPAQPPMAHGQQPQATPPQPQAPTPAPAPPRRKRPAPGSHPPAHTQHAPQHTPQHAPQHAQHAPTHTSQHAPQHASQHAAQHAPQHAPQHPPQHAPQHIPAPPPLSSSSNSNSNSNSNPHKPRRLLLLLPSRLCSLRSSLRSSSSNSNLTIHSIRSTRSTHNTHSIPSIIPSSHITLSSHSRSLCQRPLLFPPPRTNTPWTPAEELRLKQMRDAGNSWAEIAKTFPTRTEGSVKKHWYKDMHYAEFAEDESQALANAIKEYENNKWKVIGQKVGKPAKACEQYAKEHFPELFPSQKGR
ncbi:hypothetical protein MMYC01_200386 [Madurella mycetomatis]|uniref:Uncharacterized protein n=1 Tax=Madurella mycetomatis TaxID=100816 RepID=A0A175WGN8_9PEZI|nr:hypothetical protein MMYC01_200386 [Madurella mycetomatis]